ncbi:hypothetical protein [Mycoplasmopsis cynos]|nr:hypothetical protein [Mycoplasmopsis cynos]UWV81624.1 hypothetical protein NW065_00365 [Mycoplasmopsis cynos]
MQENNLLNSSIHGLSKNKKPKKYWIRKVIKEIKGFADQIFEPIKITFF